MLTRKSLMIKSKKIIGLMLIVLFSCSREENMNNLCVSNIDSMKVLFIKGDLIFNSGQIDCNSIETYISATSKEHEIYGMESNTGDTVIKDCGTLSYIDHILSICPFDTTSISFFDVRLKCLLYRKNKNDTLCISTESKVVLNEKTLSKTDFLVYNIRKSVNYYSYFPKEAFPYFPEIKSIKKIIMSK